MTRAAPRPIPPLTDRQLRNFWAKVDVPAQTSCCWEWTAYREPKGYGVIGLGVETYKAHRVAYAALIGDPTTDLDHLCRNPACVNPDHLQPVTNRENLMRGFHRSIVAVRHGMCQRGHTEFYVSPTGKRNCRACTNASHRRLYQDRKASA